MESRAGGRDVPSSHRTAEQEPDVSLELDLDAVPGLGDQTLLDIDAALDRGRVLLRAGRAIEAREVLYSLRDRLAPGVREVDWSTGPGNIDREVALRHARLLRLLAILEFETSGAEPALEVLAVAARAAASIDDEELVALTWSSRATILDRSGRAEGALEALDEAVEHLGALSPRDRTIVLLRRGVMRAHAGAHASGVDDLEHAVRLATEHGLVDQQFVALHDLGYLRHLLGDAPAALRSMTEADALDVDVSRGVGLLDRGRVLLEAGLVDEARSAFEEAIAVCCDDGQTQTEAEARYELGHTAVLLGRTQEALEHVAEAEALFDARTAAGWVLRCRVAQLRLRLRAAHGRVRATSAAGDSTPPASEDAAALASAARRLVDEVGIAGPVFVRSVRVLAGEAAALAGDPGAASTLLPDDDEPVPLLSARFDEHRARTVHALAEDAVDRARDQLRSAADDLANATLSATTLDLRTARLAHASVLADLDLSLALEDGPLAALAAVDRWRASSSRLPPVRPVASGDTAALLTERRQLREELRDEPGEAPNRWATLARIERRIAEQRRTADATALDGAIDVAPVAVDDLLAALDAEGRDVVVTVAHEDDVLAIGVVDGEPTVRRAGDAATVVAIARRVRADLRMLATRHLGPLENAVRSSLSSGAADLATRVLGEAAQSDRRLLVVPHGELAGLPWNLLAPGRPVVVAASPSAWHRARDAADVARRHTAPVRIVRGPRLVAADDEALAVAHAWGVPVPSGEATAASLVDAMGSGEVVHVVAHGQHHRQQPLFSSLSLGDGPCCLYDLETVGVTARQVVLAACDAGSATMRPGDEPLGFAAGLLALGARSVVAPVAPVPDELLPDVMGRLHEGLAGGLATDDALVAALVDAPAVAGAFVVSGAAIRSSATLEHPAA